MIGFILLSCHNFTIYFALLSYGCREPVQHLTNYRLTCCSRVSLNHLYGPSSFEKWSPPKEEDTQVASQEEEEEELFPAAPLHALLHCSRQQHWPGRRQRQPPRGRFGRQRSHSQQHLWNRCPWSWNRHRSVSCLEARRALRNARIPWRLLQISALATGVGCLGGPRKEPVISCSYKTDPSACALPKGWGVCYRAHTCTSAGLHQRLHWNGEGCHNVAEDAALPGLLLLHKQHRNRT